MMKTCCPQCHTILTLTQQQVAQRKGMVRCGVCRHVFNAIENLYDEDYPVLSKEGEESEDYFSSKATSASYNAPASPRYELPRRAVPSIHTETPHSETASITRPRPAMTAVEDDFVVNPTVERESRRESVVPAVHIHLNNGSQPSVKGARDDEHYIGGRLREEDSEDDEFTVRGDTYEVEGEDYYEERTSSFGWFWLFIILLALVLIAGQLLYVFRNQISTAYPSMRPALVQMCSLFKCEVDIQKSVNNLALENVVLSLNDKVAPKPGEQALRLQALLVNKTDKPQDWPILVLRLKNSQGVVVNSRNIQPKEYLVPELLMQPFAGNGKQLINLPFTLDGAPISGYELSIFYP